MFIFEIFTLKMFGTYKKIGEITMTDISFLPIGSHLKIGDKEVKIVSYYLESMNKVKVIVEEFNEYCDEDKMYSMAEFID